MKKTVYRLFWDYEKEEEWLNQMVDKGWAMKDYFLGRYVFEPCTKGAYIYRIELLDQKVTRSKSQDYLNLLEETGIVHVASYGNWIYLRKRADQGAFQLYSDIDSRLGHYRKIRGIWRVLVSVELASMGATVIAGLLNLDHDQFTAWENLAVSGLLLPIASGFLVYYFRICRKIRQLERDRSIRE